MTLDSGDHRESAQQPGQAEGAKAMTQEYLSTFARGLEVIRVFTRHKPRMTLSEVAAETGMTRATARRFLHTLVKEGYVGVEGRYFSLLPKVFDLGFSVFASMDIWDVVQPVLDDLAEELQESAMAAILDNDSVIYLARAFPNRQVTVGIRVGHRMPAHIGSTGRVLLAALSDKELHAYLDRANLAKLTPSSITSKVRLRDEIDLVRRQGFAVVEDEMEIGLRSISVPVYDLQNNVTAALNVGVPSGRVSAETLRGPILVALLEASRRITNALHG